jgi:exopolyphosphatase/guanosine-5'-triphosphate,3'-diphosphate pyrophosphatase
MKSKLILLLMIIIIFCSLSTAMAEELNETQQNQTLNVEDPLEVNDDVLTLDENSPDDLATDSQDENTLNLSCEEYNRTLEMNAESVLSDSQESETPMYGIVDIGSNTIHLEIYKLKKNGQPKSVFSQSEKAVTAIYTENGNLTQKGIDKFISILSDFDEIMGYFNVKTKFLFATASLRKINNSDEVIAVVKNELGLDINLISGEQEANASFNSVKDTELTTDDGIVIDLGGGSCEVIDFINKEKITSESMPIGSNSCYEDYVSGMFPNETEKEEIRNRVLTELKKLVINNDTKREDMFGIGGSIRAIKKVLIYLELIDSDVTSIPVSMLDTLLEELKDPTKENYEKILNVNAERINTFIPGLIITKTIAEYFNVTNLHVCKNSVREGLLNEILANESKNPKQNISLTVSDIDIVADEHGEISVNLIANATGTITVKLGKDIFTCTLNNGSGSIILPKLEPGNHTVKVSYSGDGNYLSNSTKISIHVKSASLDAYDMTRGWNSGCDYQAKLIDEAGNGIAGRLITFTILENQYYALTDESGIAKINPKLGVGTYAVKVSSDIAEDCEKTLKIVNRIENGKDMSVYYNSNGQYKVRIIGDDGKAETAGKSVNVIIDNKKQVLKTDNNGFISVLLDKNLNPGTHTIKVQYKGSSVENKIAVKHALSSKKLVKAKKSSKKVTLTAKLSKKLKNQVIKFKIKGKTYKVKTNKNGIAKLTIKNKFKKGKYSVKISYLKDTIQTSLKVM